MIERLVSVVVLLMAMLNLVPPFFSETMYFDNVYFSIEFSLLGFLGLSIPFLFPNMNKILLRCSFFLGAWYCAGLVYEIIGFAAPEKTAEELLEKSTFNYYLICFSVGIAFNLTFLEWKKSKN